MQSACFVGIEWIALAAYFVVTMAIGFHFYRRGRSTGALDAWRTLSGVFGGGMLSLFLLGMMLSKYLTGPWEPLRSPFHAFLIPVPGTLTILLLGLLISRVARRYEGIPA